MKQVGIWGLVILFFSNVYVGVWVGWGNIVLVSMVYHSLGGLFVALLLASLYDSEFAKLPQSLRLLIVVGCTIGIGAVWEMAEFIASRLLAQPIYQYWQYHVYFIGDLADTIQDLAMDGIGAVVGATIALNLFQRRNAQHTQSSLERPGGSLDQ